MDDGPWLYYKLTNEPKGSGELKIMITTSIIKTDFKYLLLSQISVMQSSSM